MFLELNSTKMILPKYEEHAFRSIIHRRGTLTICQDPF